MGDKLFRISTPTIKYTIDDEFDMSRVASSRFIICNMGNKNRVVKENPRIEDMSFRVDLTQEETKKLNAGVISAQIHILLNNHKVIWTDIAKTTMNGVLGEDMFDVPDYSADTGEYEIEFHGTVSDYDVPLHGHLDVTLEGSVVIPNPEGEATDDLTKVEIDGEIFLVKDSTIHDWARAEEKPTYTKAEVGLGNVDNTSDLEKPVSNATRTALNSKADSSSVYTKTETDNLLSDKVDKDGEKVLSDNNYSDTDKTKLDGIEAEANKTIVDTEISSTSTNPLQNKAIYDLLNDLLPEAEATGNPIEITNASGFNAKALTVDMLPIQDLHGYDKPWSGGSGKNKLPYPENKRDTINGITVVSENGIIKLSGTATADVSIVLNLSETVNLAPSINKIAFMNDSVLSPMSVSFRRDTTTIHYWSMSSVNRVVSGWSDTGNENVNNILINLNIGTSITGTLTFSPMLVSLNETDVTNFAPYSNICPISGRTSLDVTVNGETETLNFGQTVYGGTCDVVDGGTSDEWGFVDMGSLNWQVYSTNLFYVDIPDKKNATSSYSIDNMLSEIYETKAGSTIVNDNTSVGIGGNTSNGRVFLRDSNYSTASALISALSGKNMVYEKTTPTTLSTPATPISLNKGNNTLSTSGDNMDLKYSTTISNPTTLSLGNPLSMSLSMVRPTVEEPIEDVVEEPTEEVGEMER